MAIDNPSPFPSVFLEISPLTNRSTSSSALKFNSFLEVFLNVNTAYFSDSSRNELNFKADELVERFVRGDLSRNTEGNGLGLSIAKSLTELQNGIFELTIDGDLFKVVLKMPKI